jgi:hypothetical protein
VHRKLTLLLVEQGVGEFGKQMTFVAAPLLAVVQLHAGAAAVAALATTGAVAALAGAALNAALTRAVALRTRAVVAALASAVGLLAVPVAQALGRLDVAVLAVVIAVLSLAAPVFRVGVISLVPRLVPPSDYVRVGGRISLVQSVTAVGGPVVVGGLAVVVSPSFLLGVDSLTWFFSAAVLGWLLKPVGAAPEPGPDGGSPVPDAPAEPAPPPASLRAPILAGLAAEGVWALCRTSVSTVLALYIVDNLHFNTLSVGVAYAVGGAGFLAGAALAGLAGERLTYRVTARLAGWIALACALALFTSLVSGPAGLAGIAVFTGASAMGYLLLEVTLTAWRQTNLDEHGLSRVSSAADGVGTSARLGGAVLAGIVGQLLGVSDVLLGAAVAFLVVATVAAWLARQAAIRVPDPQPERIGRTS